MYIDRLDDIVNEYNNTYHSTIKTKPIDVKASTVIDFDKENNRWSRKNIQKKYFFPKSIFQIVQKKHLWLKKIKILYPWENSEKVVQK